MRQNQFKIGLTITAKMAAPIIYTTTLSIVVKMLRTGGAMFVKTSTLSLFISFAVLVEFFTSFIRVTYEFWYMKISKIYNFTVPRLTNFCKELIVFSLYFWLCCSHHIVFTTMG
ncbi:MAG: hypothetical protein QMO91_00010 [Candidatus Tisiphia sp.]|nr:hypothetical protein [Candidatus Tisiphia sp.]